MKSIKSILLTGANGFIGRGLKDRLNKDGYDLYEATRQNGIDLSVSNWTSFIPDRSYDCVVHLAQSSQYRDFPEGAEDMVRVNIDATAELLEWSRKHGVRSFLFASTGTVYRQNDTPLGERDSMHPNSFYGATKISAENLISLYDQYFATHIMRLFGVYGPGQKSMLVMNMIEKILDEEEIHLANGIGLKFNPIYIADCIQVISNLIDSRSSTGVTINIAGREIVSLKEMVQELGHFLNKSPRIVETPGAHQNLVADIDRLRGMMPELHPTHLSMGLEITGKWAMERKILNERNPKK